MNTFKNIYVIGFKDSQRLYNFEKLFENYKITLIEAVPSTIVKGISDLQPRRSIECRTENDKFYNLFDVNGSIFKSCHNMTTREVACTFAHMKAHRNIINDKAENAIIFEDDVLPTAGIDLLDNLHLNFYFDILMLNKDLKINKNSIIEMKNDTICSYIVKNPNSAQKYLDCFKDGLICADHPMSDINSNLKVFCTTKQYFYHDSSRSIIG